MPTKRKSAGDLLNEQVFTKPPAPKRQAKLTALKRKVTYGKQKAPKLSREILNRELNQSTVTQIWKGEFPEPEADELELNEEMFLEDYLAEEQVLLGEKSTETKISLLQEEKQDDSGEYASKSRAKKAKRKSAKDSANPSIERKNIRKSTGNIPKSEIKRRITRRKTEGDGSPGEAGLQQQTMTQWHRSFTGSSNSDTETEQVLELQLQLEEEIEEKSETKRSIYDVPSSSQSLHFPTNVPRLSGHSERSRNTSPQRNRGPSSEMGPPQTPYRSQAQEIPSSQSPATPLSLPSRSSTRKRHPLRERLNNTPSPLHKHDRLHVSPDKLPKMEIQDTFDTDTRVSHLCRIPTTPLKKSSPAKSVRFALQEEEQEENSQIETPETPTKPQTPSILSTQVSIHTPRLEVFDSDAESDDEYTIMPENETLREEHQHEKMISSQVPTTEEHEEQESQESICVQEHEDPETYYAGFGDETQIEAEKLVTSSSNSELNNDQEEYEDEDRVEEKTQMLESQRLSLHYRKSMAPITPESDVFISLHPSKITDIISRARDHEMRNWRLPPPVRRLWIYETAPVKAVKYMAEIGSPKLPGEIKDEKGLENAAFNTRRTSSSWVAYEILQVYELSDPQSWVDLRSKGWLNQPPTKFSKVPPAVAGELIYNLKSPLFISDADDAEPTSSMTDTQEAEAQLLSMITQYTQLDIPQRHLSNEAIEPEQEKHTSPVRNSSPVLDTQGNLFVPSQATTVDLTQAQTPRHQSLIEVICESPSRPVPSSSVKMTESMSRIPENQGHESLFPFTFASSQLMSKSQMLPDSLLDDSLAIPTPLIRDSDDEDED